MRTLIAEVRRRANTAHHSDRSRVRVGSVLSAAEPRTHSQHMLCAAASVAFE